MSWLLQTTTKINSIVHLHVYAPLFLHFLLIYLFVKAVTIPTHGNDLLDPRCLVMQRVFSSQSQMLEDMPILVH